MRYLLALLLVLSAVLGSLTAASAQDAGSPAPDQAEWLLVLHGDVAVAGEDEVVFVAEPRAVAFTDRPERRAVVLDTATVVDETWGDDSPVLADPPNAAVATEASDATAIVTIEDMTRQGDVLTMRYDLLEGTMPSVGDHMIVTIDAVDLHFGPNPGDG